MKKIYLVVLLVVLSFVGRAQVALPYAYDFSGFFSEVGWVFLNNDEDCFMNNVLSGQRDNAMWFISGFSECGEQYRQYIVSPRFANSTTDSVLLRFRYTIPDDQTTTEKVVVGYCSSSTYSSIESDFTWLDDTVVCTRNDIWQEYLCELPADIQYIALAYTSGNQYALLIDDVLIRSNSPGVYHPFTVNATAGGTVSVTTGGQTTIGSVSVMEGDDLTYTVTADPGWYISSFREDNVMNYGAVNRTTFSNYISPFIAPHTLDVVFGHYEYSVTIVEPIHGRIEPDGGDIHQLIVPWDTTIGFRFYPDDGYHVSLIAVTSGGLTLYYTETDTFTLSNIRTNYTLEVTFALSDYVITATAGEGGTISPSGAVNVEGLSSQHFRIMANPGYVIDSILVDTISLEFAPCTQYDYFFDEIVEDHTIRATFFHQPYIVHYAHGLHGTVTATGGTPVGTDSLEVYYEDTVVFHFIAEEGYELSDLQLNNQSLISENPYYLTHVNQNSEFYATFGEQTFQVTVQMHGSGDVTPHNAPATGYFDTLSLAVTPAACMQTDSILLDGTPITLSDTVQLTHLAGTHLLDVYFSPIYYPMDILTCSHGAVIGASEVVCAGTARLKLVPDHCYQVAHFLLDGEVRDDLRRIINDTVWAYIPMVLEGHTASAEFELRTYQVTVSATGSGSVTPDVVGTVVCDTTLFFEIVPDECHYAAVVTVNGLDAEPLVQRFPCADSGFGDTLRFSIAHIGQNQTIAVEFRQFGFPLALSAGEHGFLSASENVTLLCGTDTTITITPDACYSIASATADGVDVTDQLAYNGTSATYTFLNVHEAHALEATFVQQSYTVRIVTDVHGSVTPAEDTTVLCGDDLPVVIVPDECYQIDTIWLDGNVINGQLDFHQNTNHLIGDSALFVINDIIGNHILRASFKPIAYPISISAIGNGVVASSVSGNSIDCGTQVTITMTPDDCHVIAGVYLNGHEVYDYQTDENGVGVYVITAAQEDIYFSARFERIRYQLSLAYPTQHGVISYQPDMRDCGDTVRLYYQADDCYHLDSVMIENLWIPADDLSEENGVFSYEVPGIRSDLLLDAAFSVDSVHFVSTEGATLSVTDSILACGESLTVYSVREECKQLDSVRLNGTVYTAPLPADERMTLSGDTLFIRLADLHEDCELAVFYSQIHYEVQTLTVGQGNVSASASQIVACGDNVTIAILPNDCHHLDSVIVQNEYQSERMAIENDTLLVVNDIHSDIQLTFFFSPDMYEIIVESNEYGNVEGSHGEVVCGSDLEYVFKPSDCAMLDSVFLDGTCVNGQLVSQSFPTLYMDSVSGNHTIQAVFSRIQYSLVVETDSFTTVDVPSVSYVDCSRSFIVNIATDTCHYISGILLDGVSVMEDMPEGSRSYQFRMDDIRQNHILQVVSGKFNYSVSTEFMDQWGTRMAASSDMLLCGEDTTLNSASPDDCYQVDSVFINDMFVEVQDSYLFADVHNDIEMRVYLHRKSYTVEVLDHPHCIFPDNVLVQTKLCGDTVHVAFFPEEGYYINTLVVDGDTMEVSDHYDFPDIHDNHTLSVYTVRYNYLITTETEGDGYASPESVVVNYGDTATVILTPERCHQIGNITIDNVTVPVTDTILFTSVVENHHIKVEFEQIQYPVEVILSDHGSAFVPSFNQVDCGEDFFCTLLPDDCYAISEVFVNEVSALNQLQYEDDYAKLTLHNVDTAYVIRVEFSEIYYSCTYSTNEGGGVALSETTVRCGDTVNLSIVPEPCHYVSSVLLNGEHLPFDQFDIQGSRWIYNMADVRQDCHFDVQFKLYKYGVTVENGGAGEVFVSSDSVLCGESLFFYVVPESCSRLSSVQLNGEDITPRLVYRDNTNPYLPDTACYTIEQVFENQMIIVAYEEEEPHHIDVSFVSGTNVLARNDLSVSCGGDTTVALELDCYTLDSVLVDNVRVPETDSYTFTGIITDHTVQAMFSRNVYQIVAGNVENGAVSPADTSSVSCGGNASFTITPDQGYYIENLIVDGDTIAPSTSYSFTDVRENHTIKPVFTIYQYSIDIEVSTGGSVVPGDTIVPYGATVHYDIVPDDCYSVDSVIVNGMNQGAIGTYDFVSVTAPQTLTAYFSQNIYGIMTEVVGMGTFTAGSQSVECGGSVLLTPACDDCHQLDSVVVNGVDLGSMPAYTIDDIRENQHAIAYFSQKTYQIAIAETMEHGTVTVPATTVVCGGNATLTITPDACYSVDSVIVNGVNVGAVQTYDIHNVSENQFVDAYFSVNEFTVDVTSSAHGTVTSIGSNTVTCGTDFSITITPDDCYQLGGVWVDGVWSSTLMENDVLALEGVTENHQISVSFDMMRYNQRATCNIGGTISPGFAAPACGNNMTYEIDPLDCYRIDSVWINGVAYPNDSLTYSGDVAYFTLYDIRQENNIVVKFTGILYQFEVENNGDGTVYLAQNSVDCDGAATFSILPAQCDRIQSVLLNGNDITQHLQYHANVNPLMPDTAYYTIARMDQDQFLQINYQQLPDNHVSITYRDGTEVLRTEDTVLACAQTISLAIGYECYTVDSVLLDGVNVGAVSELPVSSNLSDRSVIVCCSRNLYEVHISDNDGGSIVFADGTSVYCGENLTCSVVPNDCYQIDSVVVNGENRGTATSVTFENVTDDQSVEAYFSRIAYSIMASAGDGGSITPQGEATVLCGDSFTYSIAPAECHTIDSVVVNGANIGAVTSFVFENITENQTIAAYFSRNEYTVTATAETGGQIVPSGAITVPCGEQQTFTIVPDDCHQIDSVVVNGSNVGAVSTYSLSSSDEAGNQTVEAYFSQRIYPVSLSSGAGGSIYPATDTMITCGEPLTVEVTPESCYSIESLMVNGVNMGSLSSYTIEDVRMAYTVSATFTLNQFALTPTVHGGGMVYPSITTMADCGSDFTFTFVPNSGYYISGVVVDGDTLEASDSYTFTDIRASHQIQPLFALHRYSIDAEATVGGTVTPQHSVVDYMGRQTVTITADDCYTIDSVFADGNYVGVYPTYTFNNVTADHTLTATFVRNEYEITASVEGSGTITPAGTTTVLCGDDQIFTISPETGWHQTELLVDGEPLELADSYTFTDIHDNHTITAQFAINEYTVTATAGMGGSVSLTDTTVIYGESVTIGITAEDCYHIDSVFADGEYVGAVASYTFENIEANRTLTATFVRNEYEITASVEGSGTITPAGTTTVVCGDNQTYTFVPGTGWHQTGLLVDGESVELADNYTFTDVRANHTITAQFTINEYTVTATAGMGGSVTPTSATVSYGESITIGITAEDCYRIDSVFADGEYVGAVASYTFENIEANRTLTATFVRNEYEITASVEGNGTITPAGTTTVVCGDNQTYTFVPETGWHQTGLLVDGEPVELTDSYTFTDVRANHTITAQFAINEYMVTATAGVGGSVTPTSATITYGGSVTIGITAEDCYRIDSVFADGEYVGAVASYTFENVEANRTLTATFVRNEYEITASVEGNGTITPAGTTTVVCGDNQTYTFVPETGWHQTGLLVDGEPVELADSYTFTDIHENHTITAQFAINEYTVTATAGMGGSVTPTSATVTYGGSVTIAITAEDCYHIDSVIVNGWNVGPVSSYELSGISENQVVEAFFGQDNYDVFIAVFNEGEWLLFDTLRQVACGSDTTVEIPLFDCYYIDSVVVNGTVVDNSNTVHIENIHSETEVVFYLSREQFVITVTKEGNGTVSPFGTIQAFCDDEVSFTFVPDEGWYVQNLILDGESLGTPAENSYNLVGVRSDHTLEVIFARNAYIITSSIDPIDAGNITPYGTTVVNYGDDQTFNIMPFPGYQVVDVEVDGVSQGAITTYTFHHVDDNHTIVAHLMTVGVEEAVADEVIAVWPNPVEDVCHIRIPNRQGFEIQLFDAQGRLQLRQRSDADELEIDLSGKPSGLYLLRIVSDGRTVATRKVIRK